MNEKVKVYYNKEMADMLKGIALILMFLHHFWAFPEWWVNGNASKAIIPLSVQGMSLMQIIGVFGTICVGIFAFVSGYAFYERREAYSRLSYRLKKIAVLLVDYWVIALFYIILCGGIMKEPFPDFTTFILNLFGFAVTPNNLYFCVTFGWYVGFYIIVILFLPEIHRGLQRLKKWDVCILISGYALCYVLYYYAGLKSVGILQIFVPSLLKWAPLVSIGYLFAKYNILNKAVEKLEALWKGTNKTFLIYAIILISVFGIKCIVGGYIGEFNMYIVYTPCFVIGLLGILFKCQKYTGGGYICLKKALLFIGKNSLNLWLLHGIFFTPKGSFQAIAYFPKIDILILIWSILILLPISIGIGKIQKFIWKKVEKIENRKAQEK